MQIDMISKSVCTLFIFVLTHFQKSGMRILLLSVCFYTIILITFQLTMDFMLRKSIDPPPFIRLPVKNYIECTRLMKENNAALAPLQVSMNDSSTLWVEIEILHKAIYKMKSRWRLEPLFRGTKQVMKCMKLLKEQKILATISSALESVLGLDGKTLVPSKQYLEFMLVKIIGVGYLAVQTIEYCQYVQTKILAKLEIGHMMDYLMSFTSFNSRVWVLSHTLLLQISKCYAAVYRLCELSSAADYTWLPDDVTLPQKFPIDVKALFKNNQFGSNPKAKSNSTASTKSATDTTSTPAKDDMGIVVDRQTYTTSAGDLGQAISREEFKNLVAGTKIEGTPAGNAESVVGKFPKNKKRKRKSEVAVAADVNDQAKPNGDESEFEETVPKKAKESGKTGLSIAKDVSLQSKKKKKKKNKNGKPTSLPPTSTPTPTPTPVNKMQNKSAVHNVKTNKAKKKRASGKKK